MHEIPLVRYRTPVAVFYCILPVVSRILLYSLVLASEVRRRPRWTESKLARLTSAASVVPTRTAAARRQWEIRPAGTAVCNSVVVCLLSPPFFPLDHTLWCFGHHIPLPADHSAQRLLHHAPVSPRWTSYTSCSTQTSTTTRIHHHAEVFSHSVPGTRSAHLLVACSATLDIQMSVAVSTTRLCSFRWPGMATGPYLMFSLCFAFIPRSSLGPHTTNFSQWEWGSPHAGVSGCRIWYQLVPKI